MAVTALRNPAAGPQRNDDTVIARELCTAFPTAHEHPESEIDLCDNVNILLEYIHHPFEVIDTAADARGEAPISHVADIGTRFCEELKRRVQALHNVAHIISLCEIGQEKIDAAMNAAVEADIAEKQPIRPS